MSNDIFQFGFADFRLTSVNFSLKKGKKTLKKDVEVTTSLSLKHDYNPETKKLRIFMGLDICGDELPFSLNIEGGALFIFTKTIDDPDAIDRLARINCAAIAYPYLRESVADIVRRAGLPQMNLPPVNFLELYDSHKKETVQ